MSDTRKEIMGFNLSSGSPHSVERHLLRLTIVLVLVLSLPLLSSTLGWKPPMSQEPLRQGNREPAGVISLEGSLAQPESLTEKAVVLDIKCLKSNPPEPITSLARQMRIKGLACQPGMGPLTLSEVQNHANGYVATTFHLGPSQFTTDYIDLVKGSNQITIDLADGQGHHQQVELTVIRE